MKPDQAARTTRAKSASSAPRKRLLLGFLLLVALVIGLVNTHKKKSGDLPVYVVGAERMVLGEEIYRQDDAKPYTYPPFFALPFLPFLVVPEKAHKTLWFFMNVCFFGGIVGLMRSMLNRFLAARGQAGSATHWLWIVTFLLAGRHVAAVFENQSHDMLVFLSLALTAWFGSRSAESLSGMAAGVGACMKATPLLFVPAFLWQRRFVAGFAALIATGLLMWLPDLVFPRSDGGSWIVAWYQTFLSDIEVGNPATAEGAWTAWNRLNQNLAASLYRLLTHIPESQWTGRIWDASLFDSGAVVRKVITVAGQLSVLGFIAWSLRPSLSKHDAPSDLSFRRLGEAGLIACGMVLLSPMSSKAHFCVLTLAMLFTVTHYARVWRDPLQLVLLLLMFVSGTLTAKGFVGSSFGNELLARGSVCWHAVIVMLTVGRALRFGFAPAPATDEAGAPT